MHNWWKCFQKTIEGARNSLVKNLGSREKVTETFGYNLQPNEWPENRTSEIETEAILKSFKLFFFHKKENFN